MMRLILLSSAILANGSLRGERRLGVPDQCKRGPNAVDDCSGHGGSCTPYPFQPDTPVAQGEPAWEDISPYTTYAFVPYAGPEEPSYQAYRAEHASDTWVVHGHDLAGAQATDCGGDVHYFEHFEEPGNPQHRGCPDVQYPAQTNWCYFNHPGIKQSFGQYQCGWWRGYEAGKAWDAGLWTAWEHIGVDAQGASSVKNIAMDWLRKCDNCPDGDGTLHTYRNALTADGKGPVAFFTGVLFPWVCSMTDEGAKTLPWTGVAGKKCYCDNEPWGGRNFGSTTPNHFMQVIYCAKYENERGMHCDMIVFSGCAGATCSGAHIEVKDFELGEASFP